MSPPLTPEQEQEDQLLADRILDLAQEELLEIARTLVGSVPCTLFGDNELKIRDPALNVAAKAVLVNCVYWPHVACR